MLAGQHHVPNGVASMYFGSVDFRMSQTISESVSDATLKNMVLNGCWFDGYYTNPINLQTMINQARQYGMFLVVTNNINYGSKNVSFSLFGKTSGYIADWLDAMGFRDRAAIAIFNEPGDWWKLNEIQYCQYVRHSNDTVKGRYPLIIVNDEYHRLNENYIFELLMDIKPRLNWGVHHLSSLDSEFKNVVYAKTQANTIGVPIWCTEGGSWSKSYRTLEGHNINKKLLSECAKYEYSGCAIVCVDVNDYASNRWKNLGYRIWNSNYTNLHTISQYWADFENELKKYKEEVMEYLRPEELQAVYDAMDIKTPYHVNTPNLYVVGEKDPNKQVTWADIDAMTETQMKALIYALKQMGALPVEFPDYPNIKYKADGSWNPNWQIYAKSNPK
jgi:hypothetical protein